MVRVVIGGGDGGMVVVMVGWWCHGSDGGDGCDKVLVVRG